VPAGRAGAGGDDQRQRAQDVLQLDRDSYLSQRGWRPTLPQRGGRVTGDFKMVDFLTFAGVAPDQRGQ
jgi:hypothetical protein